MSCRCVNHVLLNTSARPSNQVPSVDVLPMCKTSIFKTFAGPLIYLICVDVLPMCLTHIVLRISRTLTLGTRCGCLAYVLNTYNLTH
jgi:hypothetical protein